MMVAIKFFVGSRFGGWVRGTERFPSLTAARAKIDADRAAEKRAGLTPYGRRAVTA